MEKKLQRDENRKMLAGVAAGLAEYFDIDVTWVRVIFILMAVFGASGVLIYIILWIVVPPKPYFADMSKYQADYRVPGDPDAPISPESPFTSRRERRKGRGRFIAGIILVAFGIYFLADEFYILPYWFSLGKLWPVILIAIGIGIIGKSGKSNTLRDFRGQSGPSGSTTMQDENIDKPGDQPLA